MRSAEVISTAAPTGVTGRKGDTEDPETRRGTRSIRPRFRSPWTRFEIVVSAMLLPLLRRDVGRSARRTFVVRSAALLAARLVVASADRHAVLQQGKVVSGSSASPILPVKLRDLAGGDDERGPATTHEQNLSLSHCLPVILSRAVNRGRVSAGNCRRSIERRRRRRDASRCAALDSTLRTSPGEPVESIAWRRRR